MTIEEAKAYFGEKFIIPELGWFSGETTEFSLVTNKKSKAKLKHKYWYYYNEYNTDFVEQFGKSDGWVLGTVVFRRNGISFMRFEGSKDKNFEVEFFDGSLATRKLIPRIVGKKEFRNYNPEFNFIFDNLNGMVEFE